ncbi:hypothetical protein [Sodalis sp. dw_96]|uniref:hypothetical protein n=1 Tax=Sodalis sp. dw_96 TaxID=2719794 RepID=UPI001BD3B9B9|nr:hypothetical protein [Sodalis sp. dw_96]
MLTSIYHAYSLPNLTNLSSRFPEHAYAEMIGRLRGARPANSSVSMGKSENASHTEKLIEINYKLQAYTLLKFTSSDISAGYATFEKEIQNFHQRRGGDKEKFINTILQRSNKKLKDILSSCSLSKINDIYYFKNEKKWVLASFDLNLFSSMPCDHKIFCHLLLHHVHAGEITSLEDMERFYTKFHENHNKS